MVARAAELAAQPGHYATDQFRNPYPIADYRDRLGREIWEQTEGRVTAFCHGVGTAGSLMGVSDALRPRGVVIQGHEPASSAAISGGPPRRVRHAGLGRLRPRRSGTRRGSTTSSRSGNEEALEMTLRLSREEGVFGGISTGANVVGAHRLAERLGPDAVIVTLAVDTGYKYMSVDPFKEPADA